MSYNPAFEINPEQLEVIEEALRSEMGRLSKPDAKKWGKSDAAYDNAKRIREVLGHLHNQKRFYAPKESYPNG